MATIFTVTPEQRNALLSQQHDLKELKSTFQSIRDTFEKEGFVLIRGLLDQQLLESLCDAGQEQAKKPTHIGMFKSLEFGSAFDVQERAFREVSLKSAIPAVVARVLLDVDSDETYDNKNDKAASSLRLLKDAFMAKGKEGGACGWHVDDNNFWPTDSSSSGVNVWLALDDISAKYGGGLAISPKSHVADWRHEAYESIGSTPILPPEGITPSVLTKTFGMTCAMADLNKEMNGRMESSKLVLDYQPGDCLFCHRWLFHRSMPVNEEGLKHYNDDYVLKRYTIRYERGTAKLIQGISLEPSVLMNNDNSGRSLDEVCELDKPYYPQCWPPLAEDGALKQESEMDKLATETLPAAQIKKMQTVKDLMAMAKREQLPYSS